MVTFKLKLWGLSEYFWGFEVSHCRIFLGRKIWRVFFVVPIDVQCRLVFWGLFKTF